MKLSHKWLQKINTLIAIIIVFCPPLALADILEISSEIHSNNSLKFESHMGFGSFDNYLIQNIQFNPIKDLYSSLEKYVEKKLINRGEAHITVITPVEYDKIFKNYLSMNEIEEIALNNNIQEAKFSIVCLGRGQAEIDGKLEQAYYLVIKSQDLLNIRKKIFDFYLEKGGESSKFDPEGYYPHITVGFSKRDLHESDGIKKGKNSCYLDILEKK